MRLLNVLCVLLLTSCTTTEILQSWKASDASVQKDSLTKVLVAVLDEDPVSRRSSEDRMANFHPSFVASHTLLPDPAVGKDELHCQTLFKDQGVEGIIVVRIIEVGLTETFIPNNPGAPYWAGWHGRFWADFDQLGTYREDVDYLAETSVFSLKKNEVLWTGISSTFNPGKIDRVMNQILESSYERMQADGLFLSN